MMQSDKPDSAGGVSTALHFVAGFILLALVMLGIGGTIYKVIAPGGWLARLVGGSLGNIGAIMLALVGVAVFAWMAQDKITPNRRNRIGDWWVHAFAAVGLLYLVQVLWQGSL